jgi:hypothetical protein
MKECKSFVRGVLGSKSTDKEGMLHAKQDVDGHGTHCAMVAHQVAPDADTYVACIFRDRRHVRGDHVVDVGVCLLRRISTLTNHAGY